MIFDNTFDQGVFMSKFLQLYDISYQLPNGNILFSQVSGSFSAKITALIGRNGVGKSLLAQILSGEIKPTQGTVLNADSSYYLPQTYEISADTTISDLLGIQDILDALVRISLGSIDEADFSLVGDHWNIESEAVALLTKWGLSAYSLQSPATQLSGGEQMRIRIAAAFLSAKTTLILDEPSNHLDLHYKSKLWEMIQAWSGEVILITHDRYLLDQVDMIAELTKEGLIWFQGSFAEFRVLREAEKQRAIDELATIKLEEKKRLKVAQQQLERQQKRSAEASRARGNQNQAKILMDAQKNRSDHTSGKMQLKYDRAKEVGRARIEIAQKAVEPTANIVLHQMEKAAHQSAIIVEITDLKLPFVMPQVAPLSLTIRSGERMAIVGRNGIGKSLLLKVIAGLIPAADGVIETFSPAVYLDQHLSLLDPNKSVLEQISQNRTKEEISQLRMQLSQLGLPAKDIEKPSMHLSGGERLKSALALILYGQSPVELLMLDEPNNHLDLESLAALESMLQQYQGALMVVSHDSIFLETIGIDRYLTVIDQAWEVSYEMPDLRRDF